MVTQPQKMAARRPVQLRTALHALLSMVKLTARPAQVSLFRTSAIESNLKSPLRNPMNQRKPKVVAAFLEACSDLLNQKKICEP